MLCGGVEYRAGPGRAGPGRESLDRAERRWDEWAGTEQAGFGLGGHRGKSESVGPAAVPAAGTVCPGPFIVKFIRHGAMGRTYEKTK